MTRILVFFAALLFHGGLFYFIGMAYILHITITSHFSHPCCLEITHSVSGQAKFKAVSSYPPRPLLGRSFHLQKIQKADDAVSAYPPLCERVVRVDQELKRNIASGFLSLPLIFLAGLSCNLRTFAAVFKTTFSRNKNVS